MRRLAFVLSLTIAAAPAVAAQRADVRTDAQMYFDAERALQRAEDEATCGGLYYTTILHRVIDLRSFLLRLERFANRDGALDPLQRAAQEEEEQGICIGVSPREIEPNMRAARRDIRLLQQRMRRSRWRDPQLVTD